MQGYLNAWSTITCSLRTVNNVAFIIVPAEEVAWQVYSPPWDVITGLNSSVLMYILVVV